MKSNFLFRGDNEYFNDKEAFIKLEYCKEDGESCSSQLNAVNKNLVLARKLIEEKEYSKALQEINSAFNITYEIERPGCQKCAKLFRNTILNSLKQIIDDLKKTTSGIFAKKSLKPDLLLAEELFEKLNAM